MRRSHSPRGARRRTALAGAVLTCLAFAPSTALAADTLVTTGSPPGPFSQNKQNEPAVAIDPSNATHVVAGSNDEIDLEACAAGDPTDCPFTPGVGVTGVYFSTNGGTSWTQPTFSGSTARDCLGPQECDPFAPGPIGTLPRYFENGLVSDGDPAMVFGPRRGADGRFSWSNGSRLYYASLTSSFPGQSAFRGAEAIAVSRTDAFPATTNAQWKDPVIVSKQSSALFSDKEQIWADNAASSPSFGNVYVCNVGFRGNGQGGGGEPLLFARSTDAGDSFSVRQLTSATNNAQTGGRQGCAIRTDSRGRVYVIYAGFDKQAQSSAFYQVTSDNGGKSFGRPREIVLVNEVGQPDPATGRLSFDGVAGARTSTFPSVDIANGAPSGAGAPDTVALTWPDGVTPTDSQPGPNEKALLAVSTDRGGSYRKVGSASPASDRPDFPAVAISPDGTDVYVTYTNFRQPFQSTTARPRLANGVVRHASVSRGGSVGAFSDLNRGPTGDARGSSQNGLTAEFLGDYSYAFATNDRAVALWNDVRRARDCPAIDAYRSDFIAAVNAGSAQAEEEDLPEIRAEQRAGSDADSEAPGEPTPPAVGTQCPSAFGNSDIYGGSYADPTP